MLIEGLCSPGRVYTMPPSTVLLKISSVLAYCKWLIKVFIPEGVTDDCVLREARYFFPRKQVLHCIL